MKVTASAHGRVNLIGEHTDYNDGFVLPTCIPQATRVELTSAGGNTVRVRSNQYRDEFVFELGAEKARKHWADYVQGVTFVLAREGFRLGGFDVRIDSNIPIGSGLSSSAALEVALLKGLAGLFSLDLHDGKRIARLGQMAENDFAGARVGIMDQMVCALGKRDEALFIDTRDLSVERIPLPADEAALVVISSGVSHSNAHGGYNRRRAECEAACEALGISKLREAGLNDLARIEALPETLARRARHVITENARVLEAVGALQNKDMAKLGRLFSESHSSMRDDYEVSVPEIDLLVELAERCDGVFGARLTGGGFGGSIVALVKPAFAAQTGESVRCEYFQRTKREARVLVPENPLVSTRQQITL
jgi:galactokinase